MPPAYVIRRSTGASSNIATDGTSAKVSGYMLFLLGSIVALAFIRFLGCVIYLVGFLFSKLSAYRELKQALS